MLALVFVLMVGCLAEPLFIISSSYPEYDHSNYAYLTRAFGNYSFAYGKLTETNDQLILDDRPIVLITHGKQASLEAQQYLRVSRDSRVVALVLMGSSVFLDIDDSLPVLSIGGDLDGIHRVFAFALDSHHSRGKRHEFALVRGLNHLSFSSAPHPMHLTDVDIPAERSEVDAQLLVTNIIQHFLYKRVQIVTTLQDNSLMITRKEYDGLINATSKFLDKILRLLYLESHVSLLPPCSDFSDEFPRDQDRNKCFLGNKWTERAQLLLSGLTELESQAEPQWYLDDLREYEEWKLSGKLERVGTLMTGSYQGREFPVVCEDETHAVWVHFPLHLPIARNASGTVRIDCVSENMYYESEYTKPRSEYSLSKNNIALPAVSAYEIKAKLGSRQRAYQASVDPNATFFDTDQGGKGGVGNSLCAKANQLAINYAKSIALEEDEPEKDYFVSVRHSFLRSHMGKRVNLLTGEDDGPMVNGFSWIFFKPLQRITTPQGIVLRSAALVTPTEFFVQDAAGLHYCKLISPAYALEWYLTDSLLQYK